MNTATIDPTVNALLDVAALTLKFSRVPRATRHEDGIRAETDSDHTVMLTVLACAYAARYAPHLDLPAAPAHLRARSRPRRAAHDHADGQRMTTPTGMRAHNVAICDAKYNPTHKPQIIDL